MEDYNSTESMKGASAMPTKKKVGLFAIVAIIAVILVNSAFYTLEMNHWKLVTQFSKVVGVAEEPGLHTKIPFIQGTIDIYGGIRFYDLPKSDVITRDKKSMIADNVVLWRVKNPTTFYQTLGAIQARAEERVDAAVYNATKNTISSLTQDELIAYRGEKLTDMIVKESNSDIGAYGIEIVLAEIKALDLPDDNKTAVYQRMISERKSIAASYTAKGNAEAQKIRNETDRDATITIANAKKEAQQIIAEGEAEYMKILADAYNDREKAEFYSYLRGIDALKSSLKGDKTLILDKDNVLVKILYGEN